jgi:predicted HTH domain antitoxin
MISDVVSKMIQESIINKRSDILVDNVNKLTQGISKLQSEIELLQYTLDLTTQELVKRAVEDRVQQLR